MVYVGFNGGMVCSFTEFSVRPTATDAAGESASGDVAEDGGAADAEPCRDVADEVAREVSGQELADLAGLEALLRLARRACVGRV